MKQDFHKNLSILKDNKVYRVGDLFNETGIRFEKDMQTILSEPEYQNTILYRYLTCKKNVRDFASMKQAIVEFALQNSTKTPGENELVIHMRTGDIFEKIDAFDTNKVDVTLDFYNDFFSKYQFDLEMIDKITVVTALHFGSNELNGKYYYKEETVMKNIEFLKTFEQQVNDQGYDLNIVSNTSTDNDMCYMCNSKHYVPSLSPFSLLMSECMIRSDAIIYTQNKTYRYIRPELC